MMYRFDSLKSTNAEARDERYQHGDCVVACQQTNGIGQQGNSWYSEAGRNLTFSMVLEPDFLKAQDQFLLLMSVALAVSDLLGGYAIDNSMKWTNDIYVGDSKVAGILIENDLIGETIVRSIIGIGLNVNQTVFDPRLPNPTSLKLESDREFDLEDVLARLYDALMQRYIALERNYGVDTMFVDKVTAEYNSKLYLRETATLFYQPDGTGFRGVIEEVASSGEIFIREEGGVTRGYLFGEVAMCVGKEAHPKG